MTHIDWCAALQMAKVPSMYINLKKQQALHSHSSKRPVLPELQLRTCSSTHISPSAIFCSFDDGKDDDVEYINGKDNPKYSNFESSNHICLTVLVHHPSCVTNHHYLITFSVKGHILITFKKNDESQTMPTPIENKTQCSTLWICTFFFKKWRISNHVPILIT